jgi:uncharacterized protein (DUF3084 family)
VDPTQRFTGDGPSAGQEQRDQEAKQREAIADQREAIADEREQVADQREHDADERETGLGHLRCHDFDVSPEFAVAGGG